MVILTKSTHFEGCLPSFFNVGDVIELVKSIRETNGSNFRSEFEEIPIQVDQYLKGLEWIDRYIFSLIWPDKIGPTQFKNLPEIDAYKQERIKCFQNKPISNKYPAVLQRVRCLMLASENKCKTESFKELLPLLISISNRGIEARDRDDIFTLLRTDCSKTSIPTIIEIDYMLISKNSHDETLSKAIEKADCIFYLINKLNFKDTSKMTTDLVKILQHCTNHQNIEILWLHNKDDTERFSVYELLWAKLIKCYSFREKFLEKNRWRMWSLEAPCYSKFNLPLEWACYDVLKRKAEDKGAFMKCVQEEIAILSEYIQRDRGS